MDFVLCLWVWAERTCHNSPDGKRGYGVRVTSRTGRGFWENLKKFSRVEMRPASGEDGWLSLARGGLGLVSHEIGADEKANIERLCLSLLMSKPLTQR